MGEIKGTPNLKLWWVVYIGGVLGLGGGIVSEILFASVPEDITWSVIFWWCVAGVSIGSILAVLLFHRKIGTPILTAEQNSEIEGISSVGKSDTNYSQMATAVYAESSKPRRKPIPKNVKMYVWQRDQGRCVDCGSKERLEYDHIIPVSKGESNTDRNIQLLCEHCNRSKGSSIA